MLAAFDRVRAIEVAVKTLHRPSARAVLRLKHEFRALADVAHPNLLTLYDLLVEGDECFFTMELVDGVDLTTWVRGTARALSARSPHEAPIAATFASGVVLSDNVRERPLPSAGFDEERLRSAFDQLTEGVRFLHRHGKLHRDLKPSNVLVRADGQVRILDYGLVIDRSVASSGFEGTAAYAAPEQAIGTFGTAADWYAVGVMLFEALTGVLPFEGTPLQILVDKRQREAPRVDEVVVGAPPDLVELCAKLLSRDPLVRDGAPTVSAERLVGRAREIAALDAALARSTREPRVLVVEGPSGIGKTTLVRSFLTAARLRGAVVLETRCNPRESVPYNAFDGAIDELARLLRGRGITTFDPALQRLFPVLADDEVPVDRNVRTVDDDALRRRAFVALAELLSQVGSPLIVFVDDFHWADRDSQSLLAEIVSVRALFILSQRSSPAPLPWASERLVVPPLGGDAARELLGPVRDVERLVRVGGGHPLFLLEMARHGGGAEDLDGVLRARIGALTAERRAIVELVSLAATALPPHVLAVAAGLDVAATERATEALRVDRLTRTSERGIEPFHDRVRETAVAGLDDKAKQQMHRALVRALRDRDEPHALVHHLAFAGDRDEAIAAALAAAKRAEDAFAFERVALLLRDAIGLGARSEDVYLRLAEALISARRGVEAADVLLEIQQPGARARAAELLLAGGAIERGRTIMRDLLAITDRPWPATPFHAIAQLSSERLRLRVRGLEPCTALDPRAADRADLFRGVAQGLGMADNLRAAVYNARALREALDSGEPTRASIALAVEAIFRGSVNSQRKRDLIERAARHAGDDPTALAWIDSAGAVLDALALPGPHVIEGLNRAEAFFAARTRGNGWALASLKLVRALSLRLLGAIEVLRKTLPADIEDAQRRGDRYLETSMVRGAAMVALCDGDPDHARRMIEDTEWAPVANGFHIQHWLELEGYADIDLYLGRGDTLERHEAQFRALRWSLIARLQRPRILARTTRGKLLLVRARAGVHRTAALLECEWIARRLDAEGLAYATVRAELLRAGIASLRGRNTEPHLRAAIELSDRHGLALTGAVARRRLGERDASDVWMSSSRIRDPDRICEVEAPCVR